VADAREEQRIATTGRLEVLWLRRNGAPPGTTTLLADAVRTLELPDGPGHVWGGGEALAMRRVREQIAGIERVERSRLLGYWKHRDTRQWS